MSKRKHIIDDVKVSGKISWRVFLFCLLLTIFCNLILILMLILLGRANYLYFTKEGKMLFSWPILAIVLSSVIVSSFFSFIYARYLVKPVQELSVASQSIADGDYSVKIDEKKYSNDETELSRLIHSFNTMANKLSEIEMMSNDFIANVSHEFKTPLTTIQGYVTLLSDETLSSEERKKYIDIIYHATQQLTKLTSNILKISKIENNTIEVKKTEYNLSEQIREVIILQESGWSEKNINFDINLPDCMINSDEELLQQVWMNLLSNAVKFSPNDSTIRIYLTYTDKVIRVTFEDEGIGMSEETMKHIFEKFYQGESSHSNEGNGLGLALVKKIVHLCEGKVCVESKLGEGSKFIVKLPNK